MEELAQAKKLLDDCLEAITGTEKAKSAYNCAIALEQKAEKALYLSKEVPHEEWISYRGHIIYVEFLEDDYNPKSSVKIKPAIIL